MCENFYVHAVHVSDKGYMHISNFTCIRARVHAVFRALGTGIDKTPDYRISIESHKPEWKFRLLPIFQTQYRFRNELTLR